MNVRVVTKDNYEEIRRLIGLRPDDMYYLECSDFFGYVAIDIDTEARKLDKERARIEEIRSGSSSFAWTPEGYIQIKYERR